MQKLCICEQFVIKRNIVVSQKNNSKYLIVAIQEERHNYRCNTIHQPQQTRHEGDTQVDF